MNQELLDRLAREAGADNGKLPLGVYQFFRDELHTFATSVAEECAKACEVEAERQFALECHDHSDIATASENCAALIRAMFKDAA